MELHEELFESTRRLVIEILANAGLSPQKAQSIVEDRLIHGDFFLAEPRRWVKPKASWYALADRMARAASASFRRLP